MSSTSSARGPRRHARHNHHDHLYPQPPPQQTQSPPPPPPAKHHSSSKSTLNTVTYAQQQLGVSITDGFQEAYDECKATVERLAAHCRAKNRKFRDVDFDLENDASRCLHNLMDSALFMTSDVRRVPEIFDNPVFYSGSDNSAEIIKGAVEDCYLVSALSTLTSNTQLIEKLCVARDEEVGIYGFIFYRDYYWVPILIDDLLYTRVPKYEQLSSVEKELYHYEKAQYNATARKGADSLYFSRPMRRVKDKGQREEGGDGGSDKGDSSDKDLEEDGDTWVPLVEKAYAKLHGDYASVTYGRICDALEDMTGGVSSWILSKDILDCERFWKEELLNTNKDRLFGCWFRRLDEMRRGVNNASVDGLVGNLSHSVVKAAEIRGKRFVVIRDPLGDAGWEGPWADGSKEWTKEWLEILPELGHKFGGSGQFVMEYKDFLTVWQEIQRTLIFDDTWVMSSQWLHISQPFPLMAALTYGDISFTFTLPVASPAIIVLSKYNTRYFKDIQGPCLWNIDFLLAKEGERVPIAESSYSFFFTRSVNVELDLQAGTYTVLVRLDPTPAREKDYFKKGLSSGWNRRKLALILTERAKGQRIASNYKPNPIHLATPVPTLLGGDHAKTTKTTTDLLKTYGIVKPGESITVTSTTATTTVLSKNGGHAEPEPRQQRLPLNINISAGPPQMNGFGPPMPYGQPPMEPGWAGIPPGSPDASSPPSPRYIAVPYHVLPPPPLDLGPPSPVIQPVPLGPNDVLEDDNSIVVGLKVYTKKGAPTVISGQLKAQPSDQINDLNRSSPTYDIN